jgi:glycosyltransferase involved in cell wall biosynthesis
MNNKPLLSIVIPVKLNTGTLRYTLNTVLAQDYPNIQIIVSDNSDQDIVKDMVGEFNDKRIKCITPKRTDINFREDWEFALSGADGDYVTFLGDDDGALPNAYSLGMEYILNYDVDAFTWKKINYNWPDHLLPEFRNILSGESQPEIQRIDAKKALKLLSKFKIGYNSLPCIYNSIVSMSDIRSIIKKSKQKRFFSGSIPDVYSGIALASVIKKYYFASFPLTVNGASVKSCGVIQGESNLTRKQKEQVVDVLSSGHRYHEDIGEFSSSIASIVMGEYILARENINGFIGPKPSWFWYVNYLVHESKSSKQGDKIIASARYTVKKRGLLMPFISSTVDFNLERRNPIFFFNGFIKLPIQKIKNVEDASILLGGLIPPINAITDVTWKIIARQWVSNSIKAAINLYRATKL